jgi:hypothetical protein
MNNHAVNVPTLRALGSCRATKRVSLHSEPVKRLSFALKTPSRKHFLKTSCGNESKWTEVKNKVCASRARKVCKSGRLPLVPVLEHSTAEFIERYKHRATSVVLYTQTEASPLLEARVGGQVVYLFDRTGPYVAKAGEALMIVNPMASQLEKLSGDQEGELTVVGVSKLEGVGRVLEVDTGHLVVEARATLVVGVLDESWRGFREGDWLRFSSVAPIHGFFLRSSRR